jgi:hypothetical protein
MRDDRAFSHTTEMARATPPEMMPDESGDYAGK